MRNLSNTTEMSLSTFWSPKNGYPMWFLFFFSDQLNSKLVSESFHDGTCFSPMKSLFNFPLLLNMLHHWKWYVDKFSKVVCEAALLGLLVPQLLSTSALLRSYLFCLVHLIMVDLMWNIHSRFGILSALADPRGRQGRAPPSGSNFFFIFMQFLGKIDQNNRLAPPPLRLAPPPLENPGSATEMDKINCLFWGETDTAAHARCQINKRRGNFLFTVTNEIF